MTCHVMIFHIYIYIYTVYMYNIYIYDIIYKQIIFIDSSGIFIILILIRCFLGSFLRWLQDMAMVIKSQEGYGGSPGSTGRCFLTEMMIPIDWCATSPFPLPCYTRPKSSVRYGGVHHSPAIFGAGPRGFSPSHLPQTKEAKICKDPTIQSLLMRGKIWNIIIA